MKLKNAIAVTTISAFAFIAATAFAADGSAVNAKPATTDTAASERAAQVPPAAKKATPHSHLREKVGTTPTAAPTPTAEEKAAMDRMHQHPKDAK